MVLHLKLPDYCSSSPASFHWSPQITIKMITKVKYLMSPLALVNGEVNAPYALEINRH